MDSFTPTPPPLAFDSSPDQQFPDMEGFELDYDILNNPAYLDDFNLTDYYNDFTLFPPNETFIESPFTNASLFPNLVDSYSSPESAVITSAPPTHKYQCQHAGCAESFPRKCELTRHGYKHTRPFKCPHCGFGFAEKRRCVQHVQSVHKLATDADKTKCPLCQYACVRPDAVKRHMGLIHGVGAKEKGGSPSSLSGRSGEGGGSRRKRTRTRTRR